MIRNTFKKTERLSGKTTVDELFSSDKSFFCYPFKVVVRLLPDEEVQEEKVRLLVNVPKRHHKRAVARNLQRRRIKEAYRLHKTEFYSKLGERRLQLAILYSSKDIIPSDIIEKKLLIAQSKLVKMLDSL